RDVTAIVVHPTTVTLRGERAGPAPGVVTDSPVAITGQTGARRGPVVIAWDAARAGARHPERGYNVVLHEFAHKLDMLDGLVDGTPPLPDPAARRRWVDVCTAEYHLLRAGGGGDLLRPYAGVSPGEFFAVATEVFFDRPVELEADKPRLYDVLRAFYRQDPAARARARGPRTGPGT
ncbi:MAG TPA: M90 family metallopeptidase, partial [Acidimicrobiales bacterium]